MKPGGAPWSGGARTLLAQSYLSLAQIEEARGILSELWEQGYRESGLVTLARERGLGP